LPACPTCGKDLTWIPQYDRFYCYAEQKYAPKGYGSTSTTGPAIQLGTGTESHVGHYHCPSCNRELTYLTQYDRYYCYAEKKYAPRDLAPVTIEPVAEAAPEASPTAPTPVAVETAFAEPTKVEEQRPAESPVPPAIVPADAREPAMSVVAPEPRPPVVEEERTAEPKTTGPPAADVSTPPTTAIPIGPEFAAVPPETPVLEEAREIEERGRRPGLKRSRIRSAKKPQLEEWSKAYGLSTKGNRESLRNRLLNYMDDRHLPDREEVTIVEAPVPQAAPPEPVPPQEPKSELPPETPPATERLPPLELEPVREVSRVSPPEPESSETTAPTPEPASSPTPILEPQLFLPIAERQPEPAAESPPKVQPPPSPAPTGEAQPASTLEPSPSEILQSELDRLMREREPWPARTPAPESRPEPEPMSTTPVAERIPESTVEPTTPPAPDSVRVVESPARPPPREGTPSMTVEALPATPKVAPALKPAEPPVTRLDVTKALACPNCGRELTYISRYDRLYCFSCGRYAPKGYGRDRTAVEAPRVQAPAPVAAVAPAIQAPKPPEAPRVVAARPENVCPTCGRTMRYVKEYQRWWCDAERKYAPKRVKNPCPTCGKELSYVRTYDRWYCSYEKRYAPKSYQAAVSVTVERVEAAPTVVAPAGASSVAQTKLAPSAAAIAAATTGGAGTAHAHKGPGVGIVLAVSGYVILIVQIVIFSILPVAGVIPQSVIGDADTTLVDEVLQITGLSLALFGTVLALTSLRGRSA